MAAATPRIPFRSRSQVMWGALLLAAGAMFGPAALAQSVYQCDQMPLPTGFAVDANSLGLTVTMPNCSNMVVVPWSSATLTLQRWRPGDLTDPNAIWQSPSSLPPGWSIWTPNGWETLSVIQSGTTGPTVPTALNAAAASNSTIALTWTASTDNGGPGLAGYTIYRNGTPVGTTAGTSFTDTSLAASTQYTYDVAAYDSASDASGQSVPASATTLSASGGGAPGQVYQCNQSPPPTGFAVSANSLGVSVTMPDCSNMVAVQWSSATLTLQRWHPGDAADPNAIWQSPSSLPPGWSIWTPNGWETLSVVQSGTTPPTIPTGLSASGASSSTIQLNWSASADSGGPGLAGYTIYRNGTPVGTTALTSFTDTGLAANTQYAYDVAAYDAASNASGQSAPASATTSAVATAPVAPPPQVSSTSQTFPSLGMYAIQNNHDYGNAAFIARAAISDIVIVNVWNGWRDPGTGANSLQVLQAINAASTRNTKVFNYFIADTSDNYQYLSAWLTQVNNANWWARVTYPYGSQISDGGSGYWMSLYTGGPTGIGGRTYDQYAADYFVDYTYDGDGAGLATNASDPVNPLWAGAYQDDMHPCNPVAADWSLTGSPNTGSCAQWTAGQLAISQRIQSDAGGMACANLAYMQDPEDSTLMQAYAGSYDCGELENMVGSTGSIENQGLSLLLAAYRNSMALLNSNQLAMFTAYNLTSNGEDQIDTSVPYQAARHALAVCMVLGNARCDLQTGNGGGGGSIDNNVALWFDEDAVNTSTQTPCTTPDASCAPYVGYLGTAVDPPQTAAYQGCYWRRRFQYGEVWWSPASCSAGSINFGYTVNFIAGVQAPYFNTGGSGNTHEISSRDGIVVLY